MKKLPNEKKNFYFAMKRHFKRAKLICLIHYGGDPPKCACCGESHIEFLTIDHIHGGGNQHLKSIKHSRITVWLIKNNFPDGFQVLCFNCNMAKGFFGYCPHKEDHIEDWKQIQLEGILIKPSICKQDEARPLSKSYFTFLKRRQKCNYCGKFSKSSEGFLYRRFFFCSQSCQKNYKNSHCFLCSSKVENYKPSSAWKKVICEECKKQILKNRLA